MDRVHGPGKGWRATWCTRGADAAHTRQPRGSPAGGRTDGPDLPRVDRTAARSTRPARTGGSSRPGGHGARWRYRGAAARQTAVSDGKRRRRRDGAATLAAAKRLGGGAVTRRRGREREKEEAVPHRRQATTASDGGQWRRRDDLRDHLANTMEGVREGEGIGRGRGRRPKAAAMAVLTGARRGVGSSGRIRRERGGRAGPHDGERDGVVGAARHDV